ncbi:PTS fructose transporter subunit IIC [Erysipelothrix rhusiopathiae]|nr:PTS fructose transporter subunit IIC [Erysipelothrix rhusiopathiae]
MEKKLIKVPVASAISHPDSLIDKALTEADVYTASSTDSSNQESEGSNLYKHLLNGVSHMLPFVVGGGILIAIAFMLDQLIGVPTAELGQLGSYNAFPAILKDIGGQAFGFMLPVLAGYIAYSIADRPGLVVGFVAGGIASTGGAGFLGALIGGFLAGYTMNMIKKLLTNLPQSLDGIKTILLYPVLGVLVTGLLMVLINIPMKSVNEAMNGFLNGLSGTNAVLLGALLGGMMAVDLGGPINKAAYVFGTGTLAATAAGQGSAVMAAVMAAGMVPPLAVFVATLLFKHKFKAEERQAGMTNLILGASFITEGAIPFASSDPIRVIPSFVVGSALTGALSLAFNITVNAPHGGLFVILLVSQPLLYILFIIIGSAVSGLLMGILKRI